MTSADVMLAYAARLGQRCELALQIEANAVEQGDLEFAAYCADLAERYALRAFALAQRWAA